MAIVKGNYTKSKLKIKASIRYLLHRPNQKGERGARLLFNQEGLIDKERAYRLIDEAPRGTYFFRLVLSPDPGREDKRRDLNLQTITKQAILTWEKLRGMRIQFIAVEHNDHSPNRHIHAIALLKLSRQERISAKDYKAIRETATRAAHFERRLLDLKQDYHQERHFRQKVIGIAGGRAKHERPARIKPLRPTCPDCGYMRLMYALKSGFFWCPACHLKLNQQRLRVNRLKLSL